MRGLDWTSSSWGGITEKALRQDLNADFSIGISTSLTSISTDKTGARLKRDDENGLYIDVNNDGSTLIPIVDPDGTTPIFDESDSFTDGNNSSSFTRESWAVEQQQDGTFNVAIKSTDLYNGSTNIEWEVLSISSAGVIDYSRRKLGGISKHEESFNQDLNGDGSIGLTQSKTILTTDTSGVLLQRDSEGGLHILDGTTSIAIVDAYGGTPVFDDAQSWTIGSDSNSSISQSYAVEKLEDGSFLLAVNTSVVVCTMSLAVYEVSSAGLVDIAKAIRTGITKYEANFNQDLNGDGSIGLDVDALDTLSSDTTGARLQKDSENGLYINLLSDGTTLDIVDSDGNKPVLDGTSV